MINLSCFFSKKLFTSFIPILFLCAAGEALATNNGIAGRTGANGGATCESAACHAAGATVPTVTIDGPASVAPGSTTTYTVVITGGPAVNAGFGVAAPGATLAVTDAATTRAVTRAGNVEIVHSNPVNFAAGATNVSFPFSFTAPAAAGSVTIFAAGLSGDGTSTDTADGTGIASLAVTVEAAAPPTTPVADIKNPPNGTVGIPVTFDGTGSTAPAGATIATYAWTFSDGQTDTAATAVKTFPAPGNITANLTVTDSLGATGTATSTVAILAAGAPVPPTAVPSDAPAMPTTPSADMGTQVPPVTDQVVTETPMPPTEAPAPVVPPVETPAPSEMPVTPTV